MELPLYWNQPRKNEIASNRLRKAKIFRFFHHVSDLAGYTYQVGSNIYVGMSQKLDISEVSRIFQSKLGLIADVARQYAPAPDMVYDIVQQAFVDFAGSMLKGGYDENRDIVPLLYQITKNRALKSWRELRDRIPENRRKIAEQMMQLAQKRFENRKDDFEADRRFDALYDCLDALPEKSREIVRKHYFDAVPIVELAETLQYKPDALRQMFLRIRTKLKKCIEKRTL